MAFDLATAKPFELAPQYDPTEGMSGFDKFAAGMGKAFTDIGRGVGQRLGMIDANDIDQIRKQDAALMNTGAGLAGNITGNVAATLPTAAIPGVNTVTGGAALGAALGALQPTGKDESALKNAAAGGVFGAALPAALNVGGTLKSMLYDPLASQGKIIGGALTRAVGNQAEQLAQALRSGKGAATPGVQLSAGQVSGNEAMNALEDAIRARVPASELNRIASGNRVALADALRKIAKTPEEYAKAEEALKKSASGLYNEAKGQFAANSPELAASIESLPPSVMAKANSLAKLAGEPLTIGKDIPAQTVGTGLVDATGNQITKDIAAQTSQYSGKALHYIKLALDDAISKVGEGSLGDTEKILMIGAKDTLLNEIEKQIPAYGAARQKFAEMSKPLNQMDVGKALAQKLIPATSGDIPASLNTATLANAMRNPDQIARTATGFKGATMEGILSPEQLATVKGVTSDASRIAEALKAGAGNGSATARRLGMSDMIAQHIAEEAPVTMRLLSLAGSIPGVGAVGRGVGSVASMAGGKLEQRMLTKMDEMLANNPQQVAGLIEQELARVAPSERAKILKALPQSIAVMLPTMFNSTKSGQ